MDASSDATDPQPHSPQRQLDAIEAELDALSDDGLAKEALELETQIRVLRARHDLALGELDRRHTRSGPRRRDRSADPADTLPAEYATVGTWLAAATRMPSKASAGRVKLGADLRALRQVAAAFCVGAIGEAHVRKLLELYRRNPDETIAAQDALVGWATSMDWAEFADAVDALKELLDDRDPTDEAIKHFNKRGIWVTRHGKNVTAVIETTSEIWAQVNGTIAPTAARMFDDDWAEAKGRGDTGDLARTGAQRSHDALVSHLLGREDGSTGGHGFTTELRLDHDTFLREVDTLLGDGTPSEMSLDDALAAAERFQCETTTGDRVSPWFAARAAIVGRFRRIVVDATSAAVDVSRAGRLFQGLKRAGVLARDRRCSTPGCDAPAHLCEVDHIVPVSAGGETITSNGEALCRRCHQWKTLLDLLGFP